MPYTLVVLHLMLPYSLIVIHLMMPYILAAFHIIVSSTYWYISSGFYINCQLLLIHILWHDEVLPNDNQLLMMQNVCFNGSVSTATQYHTGRVTPYLVNDPIASLAHTFPSLSKMNFPLYIQGNTMYIQELRGLS